jgi:[ribosomal protein S5]-alanine N-acetyltransferase
MTGVYENCSTHETKSFNLRLVQMQDAEALLECYSDPGAVRFMNADRCTSDFYYRTLDEMRQCIAFWLRDYENRAYVRYAIVDKGTGKAAGTMEMFGGNSQDVADWGMLRIDIASRYEKTEPLGELIGVATNNFYQEFSVKNIVTKAIGEAGERRAALQRFGFESMAESSVNFDRPRDDYFIRSGWGAVNSNY